MNELPTEIELSELTSSPREMHGIYDRSPAGTYCLTPGGHLLRRLKEELIRGAVEHSHWFKAGKPAASHCRTGNARSRLRAQTSAPP